MSKVSLLQLSGLVLSFIFIYWGARTVFSKKYFLNEIWNKNNPDKYKDYKDVPLGDRVYVRFGWGGRWLLFGLGLIGLVIYSFFR